MRIKKPNLHFKRITSVGPILILIANLGLLTTAQAVTPSPDGGYPGGNTAEGQNALLSLTSGTYNTAIGWFSLKSSTTNGFNTALGAGALFANTADGNTGVGAAALFNNTTGVNNTAEGVFALLSNTAGSFNTASGDAALQNNSTGSDNTANGNGALFSNIAGIQNTASGSLALYYNTGSYNTAYGYHALLANTSGSPNSAFGWGALLLNTTGNYNTASGYAALYNNVNGNLNTAHGDGALFSNSDGNDNTATGTDALYGNIGGDDNTATGYQALASNTTGNYNTAAGAGALFNNTGGANNTAIGNGALYGNTGGGNNTAVGFLALRNSTGIGNIALGDQAGSQVTDATNVISIGSGGANVNFSCYIGNIYGQSIDPGTATGVFVDTNSKLGTTVSARRFKRDIRPMEDASQAILSLHPVTFHYKSDAKSTPCFGLIAEDVEKINPALVVHDKKGEPLTVRYDQVNAMLLNEFLKEHKKVQEQKADVARLKSMMGKQQAIHAKEEGEVQALAARLKEQASQIRRVSAAIQLGKAKPQITASTQASTR